MSGPGSGSGLDKEYRDHVDRYAALDEPVRDWLERATKEKLDRIDDLVKLADHLEFTGKLGRFAFFGLLTTTVLFAAFGDAIKKIFTWWPK